MDVAPKNRAVRPDELALWADEQRRRLNEPVGQRRLLGRLAERLLGAPRLARYQRNVDRTLDGVADRLWGRGVDTSTHATLPEHSSDRIPYVPSPWHVLPRALRHVGVSESDTFVEFGCGKGRVVHQAARYPFRRVVGVEVSAELAEIAREVVAAHRHRHRCGNVEIVVADVREFQVPDDLTVAYFFRPFGDETLGPLLQAIVESIDRNPRRVRLIYVWPLGSRSTILRTGRFRLVKEQSSSLIHRGMDGVAIYESC